MSKIFSDPIKPQHRSTYCYKEQCAVWQLAYPLLTPLVCFQIASSTDHDLLARMFAQHMQLVLFSAKKNNKKQVNSARWGKLLPKRKEAQSLRLMTSWRGLGKFYWIPISRPIMSSIVIDEKINFIAPQTPSLFYGWVEFFGGTNPEERYVSPMSHWAVEFFTRVWPKRLSYWSEIEMKSLHVMKSAIICLALIQKCRRCPEYKISAISLKKNRRRSMQYFLI